MTSHAATAIDASHKSHTNRIGNAPFIGNNVNLYPKVIAYIEECAELCQPDRIYICEGTEAENAEMLKLLEQQGTIQALPKYDNW